MSKFDNLLKTKYVMELIKKIINKTQIKKPERISEFKKFVITAIKRHKPRNLPTLNLQSQKKTKGGSDKKKQSPVTEDDLSKIQQIETLFEADINLEGAIKKYKESSKDLKEKKILNDTLTTLNALQENILNLDTTPREVIKTVETVVEKLPANLMESINKKIKILTEINNQRFPGDQKDRPGEQKADPIDQQDGPGISGGSISTNNSIRKQIFTDLKYITKYLKYKTKYIVFKSKH